MTYRTKGFRHVVAVDDSETVLKTITNMLEELPAVFVHPFVSSREALAWSLQRDVDCFVLDYHMPEPDGLQMTKAIRADPRLSETPIVIVTGESDMTVRTNLLVAGANDYLTLPVHRLELVARLKTLLALQDARKALEMQIGQLEHSLVTSEQRARAHAARLEALWRVANNPKLHGDARVRAMLQQAVAAIRPEQPFRGLLGRLEGDEIVLLAMGAPSNDNDPRAAILEVGTRAKIAGTIVAVNARTQVWDDLRTLESRAAIGLLGWRSAISTRFSDGVAQYSMTFASTEPVTFPFGPDDAAYVELLSTFFASHFEVDQLEHSLRDSEQRSRQHAERLEALSHIINNPALQDEELLQTMLREAAAAIRPEQSFRGMLARIDGPTMILEALADHTQGQIVGTLNAIGREIPLEGSLAEALITQGRRTGSWDDLLLADSVGQRTTNRGWRAFICTTFQAGGSTRVLSFASPEPTTNPFGPQEHAYIEIVASFFANQLQQRWQFDRIQYQQTHDALTGLLNRSQFRSRARVACADTDADRYSTILIDVNALRAVNEKYGHMIGDALLVEIATALRARVAEGEIAGRLGGDVFAIYVPNVLSKTDARRRAIDFAEIFNHPFSTGDREGKEFIALSACLGVATAPADGSGFDAILARADAALFNAKEAGPGTILAFDARMKCEV